MIGKGPTLRLGGGPLVKACAARWRLSKTMGTLKATVDIPSYKKRIERQTKGFDEKNKQGRPGPISGRAVSPWRHHDRTASADFDHPSVVYAWEGRDWHRSIYMLSSCIAYICDSRQNAWWKYRKPREQKSCPLASKKFSSPKPRKKPMPPSPP